MGQYRMLRSGDILEVKTGETPRVLRNVGKINTDKEYLDCVHPYGITNSLRWRTVVENAIIIIFGTIFIMGLVVILRYLTVHSFFFGKDWVIGGATILVELLYIVFVALVTSVLHELGHLFFGKTISVSGSILRSTFRTNLNHIWVWSSPARFVAICSGLVIDILIAALLILILPNSSPWLSSALSTIIFRIFWEFNITRKTDARWILCLAFDNPLLMINLEMGKLALVVHLLGIAYDVTLLLLWPLLFALSSIGLLI